MGIMRTEQERYRESVPALMQWYAYNARVLPWRSDPTPYHVWISEIMLQQTRVEAVRGYYERFLAELPTIRDVAEASEDRLIKLWEGLGYYSRVRNIGKAAKMLCERYGETLPADYDQLCGLPGIGEYTAGAIASIAYGHCVPAVDGNVLRVFARLTAYRDDIRKDSFKKHVRTMLTAAMREKLTEASENDPAPQASSSAGQFNQAVMDIGATVCIPNGKPHCDVCPLSHLCAAFAENLTGDIPARAEKKARPTEKKTVFVIRCGEKVLLHRRPQKGLLAGMWELPNAEGHLSAKASVRAVTELLAGIGAKPGDLPEEPGQKYGMKTHRLEDSRHIFSHVEWEMRGYRIEVDGQGGDAGRAGTMLPGEAEEYTWVTPDEIAAEYGLPQAFRAYKLQL